MKSVSASVVAPLLVSPTRAAVGGPTLLAYVGTYTSPLQNMRATQVDLPPGNGRGIHVFQVDVESGAMKARGVVEMGTSPSCLVFNADKTRLYSTNETERIGESESGSVSAFAVQPDGSLKLMNTVASGGKGSTYISLHPSGRFALVANYFGGSVSVLPVKEDGSLGVATDVKKTSGTVGPTKAPHAPPGSFAFSGHDQTHCHMIETDPTGRFVLSVDLGLDQIQIWRLKEDTGTLIPHSPPHVQLPPGDGPRHFAFHPNKKWLFSLQEEGSTIVRFDWDSENGRLTEKQTISSLPPGFAGSNFCSEIMVSADGRFVYAGNRLHDSIAVFSIAADGTLAFVADEPTRGNYPRSFNFDPSNRMLFCCNQRGDNITSFRVDKDTGKLRFTGRYTPVGNPSIVVFKEIAGH